jgi:hypothetical protein
MKYVVRRFVFGLILIPVVAVAYTAFYALLVLAGGIPTSTIQEVFALGLEIGLAVALLMQFPGLVKKVL